MREFLRLDNKLVLELKIKPKSPLLVKLGRDTEKDGKSVNTAYFILTESSNGTKIDDKTDERCGEIYIPGSTLKGIFRTKYGEIYGNIFEDKVTAKEKEEKLFGKSIGDDSLKGRIFLQDAYLFDDKKREKFYSDREEDRKKITEEEIKFRSITPIDHFSGEVIAPLMFEYTKDIFLSEVIVNNISEEELKNIYFIIRDSLNGEIIIGSSKTRGFGQIEFEIANMRLDIYNDKSEFLDRIEKYFEVDEKHTTKLGEKYLCKSLKLKDDFKQVDIENPNEFITALFGEVR